MEKLYSETFALGYAFVTVHDFGEGSVILDITSNNSDASIGIMLTRDELRGLGNAFLAYMENTRPCQS
jgi:hypothetical protein